MLFVPLPNFCITQSQSQFFYFLSPEVSDSKTRGSGRPSNIFNRSAIMILFPSFFMTQSQSSVIKYSSFIFLLLEVSNINLKWMGGITPQIIWRFCWLLKNWTKFIKKIGHFAPILKQNYRAVSC